MRRARPRCQGGWQDRFLWRRQQGREAAVREARPQVACFLSHGTAHRGPNERWSLNMYIGPLHAQAESLTAGAARIAAALLAEEPMLPIDLRSALRTALLASDQDHDVASVPSRHGSDVEAARRFVEACKLACARS